MMKILLKKSQAEEPFTFVFQDSAGKALLKSENYKAKDSARNGIDSVKKNCQNDARYESKESRNGKFFFNIKAANGQIVGTSTLFSSAAARDQAIALLKKEGGAADIEGT